MSKKPTAATSLAVLAGILLAVAIILATDQVQAYGYALAALVAAAWCATPSIQQLSKKGGASW